MFSTVVQPSVVSIFSSTGTAPLQLFEASVDPSLPADYFIHLLHDEASLPKPAAPAALIPPPSLETTSDGQGYSLNQTVLQIQSPTLWTTYIQCPPVGGPLPSGHSDLGARDKSSDLGLKHPWMHIQVRNMGRQWSLEVGLVDQSGRMGILRLSTFQKQPRLRLPMSPNSYPLLHLPLAFPPSSSRPLTAWSTVTLCLPSYLPYFSSPKLIAQGDDPVDDEHTFRNARANVGSIPSGTYSHVAYIRVYATCRLRRIWFDESGPSQKVPWEFELYGNE
ncbi:Cilia- and flagella-associated protein 20 [Hypsizygus marmoreus]|uniref:Cilia- and flagella-associated protein 20 n=1 Tax=Hypsizygus marmoreus TaxID=39966 RepID=A0A369K5N2_HYPMA|nr:Cilia- and flagella-associated protein 20 [Hypsizygus marmoreus]